MDFDAEKMRGMARPSSDREIELRRCRRENAEWLNASAKIALRVRVALRAAGVSHAEFARRMGVTPAHISKILSGKENLSLKTICGLEDALGVKVIFT